MSKRTLVSETYLHGPRVESTALTTLQGIIIGVTCDKDLNDLERNRITDWVDTYDFLKDRKGIGSVFDVLSESLADGVLTIEEVADLNYVIGKNLVSSYGETTQKIQKLHGILAGIAADKVINAIELTYLWKWLNENESLKGMFPFDEVYTICVQLGQDRKITDQQHQYLVQAFSLIDGNVIAVDNPFMPWAIDPQIDFAQKKFCVTGVSKKMARKDITEVIQKRNGLVMGSVSKFTDYLIVFSDGSAAWTHSSYGRKIEEAISLRKSGAKITIVSESDFWDALVE